MAVSIFKRPLNKEVEQIKSDIGIVENGTTATHNIASGQYVIWQGNLCTALYAILPGDTLSSSNMIAVSNGGLNALNSDVTTLSTKLSTIHDWYGILSKSECTTSYVTKDTYNSRKISDYKMLLFMAYYNTWLIGTIMVPSDIFISGVDGVEIYSFWTSAGVEVDFKYSSDTKIQIKKITTASGTVSGRVIGFY